MSYRAIWSCCRLSEAIFPNAHFLGDYLSPPKKNPKKKMPFHHVNWALCSDKRDVLSCKESCTVLKESRVPRYTYFFGKSNSTKESCYSTVLYRKSLETIQNKFHTKKSINDIHVCHIHKKSSLYLPCRFSQHSIEIPGATWWNRVSPGCPMKFHRGSPWISILS